MLCADQVDSDFLSEIEPSEMTLIVSIKTKDSIILAADGMGYTHGEDQGNIPYHALKLHRANTAWVIAFSGSAAVEVQHQALEAEISKGSESAVVDSNIDIGGPDYIEKLRAKIPKDVMKEKTTLTLAGFTPDGRPRVFTAIFPVGPIINAPDVSAHGAQKGTAQWILNMFSGGCTTNEQFRDLAAFSIWQIANQELTVGRMELGYRLSCCILKAGCPSPSPIIEQLEITPTLARMNNGLKSLQDAFSSFLSTPRIATSKTNKDR